MKTPIRLFAAAVAASISLTGFAACKSAEPYAAKVNGATLSKSALDDELNAIRGNAKYRDALKQSGVEVLGQGDNTFDAAFVARVLTRRIYLQLVHAEVVKRKLEVKKSDLEEAHQQLLSSVGDETVLDKFPKKYLEEIERTTAEVSILQNALADTSDKSLRAYYDSNKEQYEEACAAHILVETKAEADAIEKTLDKASDKKAKFAEEAKAKSKDPGSGANGGDLGCASPANYVAEFKDAVRTQEIGVIGDPVKTQFGYHIIRVDSRKTPEFSEVKAKIKEDITSSQQGPFNTFLQKASSGAKVEVNPRYGKFDKSGESPQVTPPKSPDAAGSDAAG